MSLKGKKPATLNNSLFLSDILIIIALAIYQVKTVHHMQKWLLPHAYSNTVFLAHLSWRLKVSYCDWSLSGVRPPGVRKLIL